MTEFSTRGKAGSVRWAITGIGGGAGIAVVAITAKLMMAHPEMLQQLLNSGLLYFGVLVVGMVMFDRQLRTFNANSLRSVVANETLAQNVGLLVDKDDRRAEAQEAATRYLAGRTDLILEKLAEIQARMPK